MREAFCKAIKTLNDLCGFGVFYNYELEDGSEVHIDAKDGHVWHFTNEGVFNERY